MNVVESNRVLAQQLRWGGHVIARGGVLVPVRHWSEVTGPDYANEWWQADKFAEAVAAYQMSRYLLPSGLLDKTTWRTFLAEHAAAFTTEQLAQWRRLLGDAPEPPTTLATRWSTAVLIVIGLGLLWLFGRSR